MSPKSHLRKLLIEKKGGKCRICGYSGCNSAMELHHRNPKTKKFNLSGSGLDNHPLVIFNELEKCELLCVRCHREVHERLNKESNI